MSGKLLTGEQRFCLAWSQFRLWMKDLKKEAREDGSGGEAQEKWLVDMESIKQHYGLAHTVTKHLKEGKNMSLSEFEKLCLYVFSFYDSEWERQVVWMNVGTTLFFHTKECKDLNFEPFSRPLGQVMEEKVTAEVSKLADINRRYYEMMAEK